MAVMIAWLGRGRQLPVVAGAALQIHAPKALLVTILVLSLCGCTPVTASQPKQLAVEKTVPLRVAGSNSMQPLLNELAHEYMRDTPQVKIEVTGGGSRFGFRALQSEEAEIAMMSRPVEEEDYRPGAESMIPVETVIARDALVVIVHPSNPINGVSSAELADLLDGQIYVWDDLGWPAGKIQVVSREPGSGDRGTIERELLAPTRSITPNALLLPNPKAVLDYVSKHPNALGYLSFAQLEKSVKVLELDGVSPTMEALAADNYPLARNLLLVTDGTPLGESLQFLEWVLDKPGQGIIRQHYLPAP